MPPASDPLNQLDERLERVEEWIDTAGAALLTFHSGGELRRSTMSSDASTTATYRGFLALMEWQRVCRERNAGDGPTAEIDAIRNRWIVPLRNGNDLKDLRTKSSNKENDFTDGNLLTALAVAHGQIKATPDGAKALEDLASTTSVVAEELRTRLGEVDGGSMQPGPQRPVHDLITLYALRGIDAYNRAFGDKKPTPDLRREVRARVLRQLGYHSADLFAEFDPGELMFGTALLAHYRDSGWDQLSSEALNVVADAQSEDGAWPSARVLAYEVNKLLHVPSYELALVLANLAFGELAARGTTGCGPVVLKTLDRSMRMVCDRYATSGSHRGWANDRVRWPGLIESWTTAVVLTFLVRYREVLLSARQHAILERYDAEYPEKGTVPPWPELDWVLPPVADRKDAFPPSFTDPLDGKLVERLRERILDPVENDPARRPAENGASLVLYGDPGTRKTSLVKRLGQQLGWPVMTLSPPNFLGQGGLDGFEAAAEQIFKDLGRLRRCVVLLDECEDFFKPRPRPRAGLRRRPAERVELRTIGAFLTAGMLPRLQELREGRWVILVLATNSRLEDLDRAVTRPGRFDYAQEIGHPILPARLSYAANWKPRGKGELSEERRESLRTALQMVRRRKLMPFAVIDDVARDIVAAPKDPNPADVAVALSERRKRQGPPSLYPTGREASARRRGAKQLKRGLMRLKKLDPRVGR